MQAPLASPHRHRASQFCTDCGGGILWCDTLGGFFHTDEAGCQAFGGWNDHERLSRGLAEGWYTPPRPSHAPPEGGPPGTSAAHSAVADHGTFERLRALSNLREPAPSSLIAAGWMMIAAGTLAMYAALMRHPSVDDPIGDAIGGVLGAHVMFGALGGPLVYVVWRFLLDRRPGRGTVLYGAACLLLGFIMYLANG